MIKCPLTGKVCMKYKAFHITNINDKKEINILNVCEDCLSQVDKCESNMNEHLIEKENNEYRCDFCKLTLEELLKTSRIGCENCYKIFEKPLIIAFEKMQRTPDLYQKELTHTGGTPEQWKRRQAQKTNPNEFLSILKNKIDKLIIEEKYEKCKELKEKIYAFNYLLKKLDEFKNDLEQQNLILNQIYEFIYFYNEKELEK